MNRPKVSIIVPVYNVEKYIARCLDSILNQTYDNIEVVVVDDGSPDASMQIVAQYAQKDNRIKVVSYGCNRGLMVARDFGFKASTGSYIMHVDSDDYIVPDAVAVMLNAAQDNGADLVCGNFDKAHVDGTFSPDVCCKLSYGSDAQSVYRSVLKGELPHNLCGKLFSRDLYSHDYNIYEHMINAEDAMLFYQLVQYIKKAVVIDHVVYHYFVNTQSSTHVKFTTKAIDNIVLANTYRLKVAQMFPSLKSAVYRYISYVVNGLFIHGVSRRDIYSILDKYHMRQFTQVSFLLKNLNFIDVLRIYMNKIGYSLLSRK